MLKAFISVFLHEFKRIFSNRHLRLVCLLSPFFYVIVLTSVYHEKRLTEVPVGIADLDKTQITREAARFLDSSENLRIAGHYDSADAAQHDLVKGRIYGYFYFPKGFSSDIKKGKNASYRVAADYMNIALANPIFLASADVAGELSSEQFSMLPGKPRLSRERAAAIRNLVRPQVHTIFNREMNYADFFLPGLVVVIIQQVIIVSLCFCGAEDKQEKLTDIYRLSGQNPFIAAGGRIAPYILLNYAFSCLFILIWLRIFDLRLAHSMSDSLLFIFVFVSACCSFGLMLSSFFRKTADVFLVLMYFAMGAFLVSGYSWPSYMLPLIARIAALPIPSTYFMSWLRMAFGAELPPAALTPDFWILAVMAISYFMVSGIMFRRIYGHSSGKLTAKEAEK